MNGKPTAKHTCPTCGWSDTRRSLGGGAVDNALALLFLQPYRCRKCLTRFFRFGTRWASFVVPATLLVVVLLLAMIGYRIMDAHAASVPLETATPSEINSDPNHLLDRLGLAQTDENLDTGGMQKPPLPEQGQPPPESRWRARYWAEPRSSWRDGLDLRHRPGLGHYERADRRAFAQGRHLCRYIQDRHSVRFQSGNRPPANCATAGNHAAVRRPHAKGETEARISESPVEIYSLSDWHKISGRSSRMLRNDL